MEYLILFLAGICGGSFLSTVIYRKRVNDSALRGRSYCDHCKKQIYWFDNIPLLSFILLKGRCRHCRKKISIEYPLTELIIGLQFVWIYWLLKINFNFFNTWEGFYSLALLFYWLILFGGSLALAIYDWKEQVILDEILWPLIVLALARLLVSGQWQVLPAGLGASAFLGGIWLATKRKGMGLGDVKLAFLMGIVLGYPRILIGLALAFLTGAVVGVILILLRRKSMRDRIAFGPFLVLGMFGAKIWGDYLWQWYQKVLLF